MSGFLIGGPHPELGSPVHTDDGAEMGSITFFYSRLDGAHWLCQVTGAPEDPMTVEVNAHRDPDREGGLLYKLYARPGKKVVAPEAPPIRLLDA